MILTAANGNRYEIIKISDQTARPKQNLEILVVSEPPVPYRPLRCYLF